jgi:hypothetical protein
MTPQIRSLFLSICLFLAFSSVFAAPALQSGPLSQVKQLYKDGEFEKVRTQLEAFLKHSDASASREDRILAYKYLGVVYASKPDGTPQAEAYFFRLFDLAPAVQITELYVSSTVNDVFKKTRERFISETQSSGAVDEFGNPLVKGNSPKNEDGDAMVRATSKNATKDSLREPITKAPIRNTPNSQASLQTKKPKIWPWILGAAVVGGGVGVYLLTSQESQPDTSTITAGK